MKRLAGLAVFAALVSGFAASTASANHSWNGYHWARTSNPFTLKVGNNLTTADWVAHYRQTLGDWSRSTVLDLAEVAGGARNKQCRPTSGRDEVCNGNYGQNGWLGVASIWIQSGTHITQGTEKMNDTYFALPPYNNSAEKEHVMCQEIGHTFGLGHQDESGASLNTCMDYYHNTSDSDTKSTTPNQHDYDQLVSIYSHTDSSSTVGGSAGSLPDAVPSWAQAMDRSHSVYIDHLPNGVDLVTFVIWANPIHGWGG
jgi:hypothetical protein